MAPVSAAHHYIPKVVLRGFSKNKQSVWYFSKSNPQKGVHVRNIDSIFQKRHLNTVTGPRGHRDDSLEVWFAREFDDRIGPQLQTLLNHLAGCEQPGAQLDRDFLVQFLFNHMRRTPEIEKLIDPERIMRETTERALATFDTTKTFEEIFPIESRPKVIQETLARVRSRQSEKVLNDLYALTLVVAVPAEANSAYIIGSQPVARLTNDGDLSIESGDVELWAPLHSKLAIGLVRSGEEGRVVYLPKAMVKKLNQVIFYQSTSVAAESAELVQSIAKPYLKHLRGRL